MRVNNGAPKMRTLNSMDLPGNAAKLPPEGLFLFRCKHIHDLSPLFSFHVGLKQIISFKKLMSKIGHDDSGQKRENRSEKGETGTLIAHQISLDTKLAS